MRVPNADVAPPWSLVLSFEFELRKAMARFMRDDVGLGLPDAMCLAIKDPEVREQHFITPFLSFVNCVGSRNGVPVAWAPPTPGAPVRELNGLIEPPPAAEWTDDRWQPYGKGKKSSKGKSKGKVKGSWWTGQPEHMKAKPGQLVSKTEDGREICFAYNNLNEQCAGHCGRLHICRVFGCFERHEAHGCSKRKQKMRHEQDKGKGTNDGGK